MSRISVVLLLTALLSMAPGLALGDEEPEKSHQASAAQSEEAESCEASGEARYCPARSQAAGAKTLEALEMPVYVPPGRGSPATRIGGANRGGARPVS